MFIHAIPDNKGHKNGFYCSLVESKRIDGKPVHVQIISFGFIPRERLPYLKATFNAGDPDNIVAETKRRLGMEAKDGKA